MRRIVMESLLVVSVLAAWLIFQIWVLPKLGVPT